MKLSGRAYVVVAAIVPCMIVFWLNAVFVWNHFVDGAFLHDSGWYSAIVWRSGVLPKNPLTVHGIREYYGIHVSPLVSIASVLSYLAPIGRVRWYCLFQGVIYAPLGAVVAMLGRGRKDDGVSFTVGDAARAFVVSLLFAFDGQVLACIGYPHFEIFVSTGVCLMLTGLATGRARLAWIGLACAAATREDGGFHAAAFLAAVLASDLLGRPFRVPRRTVLFMGAVAAGTSVLCFVLQKKLFVTADLFRHEYLGEPAFGHIDGAVLAKRLRAFFEQAPFVAFPLVATVVVAVARRDPRYLFGWVVELPWLLLNFLAFQELKSVFTIYTGFPFVGSIFWVGAYAATGEGGSLEATTARSVSLRSLGLVSLLSTLGLSFANPNGPSAFLARAAAPRPMAEGLRAFVAELVQDPRRYGSLYVDPGITSLAIESVRPEDNLFHTVPVTSFEQKDGAAFFADGAWRGDLLAFLGRSPFRDCASIPETRVFFCGRAGAAPPPMFTGSGSLMTTVLWLGPEARREGDAIALDAVPRGSVQIYGPFMELPAGRYLATWKVAWRSCIDAPVARGVIEAVKRRELIASRLLEDAKGTVELPFELAEPAKEVELRTWSGRCGFRVLDVTFRTDAAQRDAAPSPDAAPEPPAPARPDSDAAAP